jgi:two-component system LytT family sensor kinase
VVLLARERRDVFTRLWIRTGLVRGVVLYTRVRDTELRVATLQREWTSARLAALRMQLSPHTLFNLLHTIRGNIEWDPRGAQAMVVQLADLLRRLLNAGERDFSRLTDELQFIAAYLELQQRRFPDRISFMLPAAGTIPTAWVPSLILQPLVENAVVHGLAGHQGPLAIRIEIDANHAASLLRLRVINTVAAQHLREADGIGLKNVRERLTVQFEQRGVLRVAHVDKTWTAEIEMPLIELAPINESRIDVADA